MTKTNNQNPQTGERDNTPKPVPLQSRAKLGLSADDCRRGNSLSLLKLPADIQTQEDEDREIMWNKELDIKHHINLVKEKKQAELVISKIKLMPSNLRLCLG